MKIFYKKIKLIILISITGFLLYLSGECQVLLHVGIIVLLAVGSCFIAQFDFFHPMCWYPPFYAIYSCAYAVLYYIDYNRKYGYSKEVMVYQWLALAVFLVVIPTRTIVIQPSDGGVEKNTYSDIGNIVLNIILTYILFSMVILFTSSFSGKTQIYNSGNQFLLLAFKLAYFAIIVYSHELYKRLINNIKISKFWYIKTPIVIVLFGLLTGERDYMFTIVLITLLLLFFFGKISKTLIIAIVPLGIIALPISHFYKFYLLDNRISGIFSWNNLFVEFLDGEFISAGRNLQILVAGNYSGYFHGKTILNDFIIPIHSTGFSVQTWFNNTFFPSVKTTMYGFTLVGEGYVNAGGLGVVLVFAFVSFLLGRLYLNVGKNRYMMVIYLFMIPLFIYTVRADVANILSPFLHYAVLGSILVYLLDRISMRYRKR